MSEFLTGGSAIVVLLGSGFLCFGLGRRKIRALAGLRRDQQGVPADRDGDLHPDLVGTRRSV